jgi:hypothetical protein
MDELAEEAWTAYRRAEENGVAAVVRPVIDSSERSAIAVTVPPPNDVPQQS